MDTVLRDNWPWTGLLGLDGYVPTPTVHKPTPHGPSLAPRTGAVPFFETRAGGSAGCQPSGEQVRTALRQPHERAAVVNFQPAQANRVFEARRVFRRRPFVAE